MIRIVTATVLPSSYSVRNPCDGTFQTHEGTDGTAQVPYQSEMISVTMDSIALDDITAMEVSRGLESADGRHAPLGLCALGAGGRGVAQTSSANYRQLSFPARCRSGVAANRAEAQSLQAAFPWRGAAKSPPCQTVPHATLPRRAPTRINRPRHARLCRTVPYHARSYRCIHYITLPNRLAIPPLMTRLARTRVPLCTRFLSIGALTIIRR